MDRKQQLPQYIQTLVGEFIVREVEMPEGILPTVTRVELSSNQRFATVWFSVFPDNRKEECLKILSKYLYDLQGEINKKVQTHPAPRLSLKIDQGPSYSAHIEEIFEKLDE